MTRDEAKEYIKQQSPAAFMEKAKKRGFVCPKCGNGSGKDGDGIVMNPKTGLYKCFKCGEVSGDVFELVGAQFGLTDFGEKFRRAVEIYHVSVDAYHGDQTASRAKTVHNMLQQTVGEDVSDYISRCAEQAEDTEYFHLRGLSDDIIRRFRLGYDPCFTLGTGGKPWKAAVIPTSASSYSGRNTEVEPNSADNGKNKYRKKGAVHLFNAEALENERDMPVFVTEGEFDAMSIIQCGGQAVALGSTSNYELLLRELDRITPQKPLVLVLDPDEAGMRCLELLCEGLEKRRTAYMRADILGGYHDPNARLVGDPDGLRKAVSGAVRSAEALPSPADAAREAYLSTSAAGAMQQFTQMISNSADRVSMSTDFPEIDKALDGGLRTGLYILGAISSLGKTTLTLQIADSLAMQGHDVLFFTLEQSRFELMSKSISRETYEYCTANGIDTRCAKSSLGISDGSRWGSYNDTERDVINGAFAAYGSYASHLFIHEGIGSISAADIREVVKNHISYTGCRQPAVFIDYLQIIRAAEGDERCSDKQIVDRNVTALKQLSRDFDIPVFAVSSLNRDNYSNAINMAAFKESGAIEYGSDVLIGLQLHGAGSKDFDVNTEKAKNPREIDFCILKNRSGQLRSQGIPLLYNPTFNHFGSGGKVPLQFV